MAGGEAKIQHKLRGLSGAAYTCGGLLLMFAMVAWSAISQKCSTYDEPVHAIGSWVAAWHGDFRIDAENPPLWQYWAALPQSTDALRIDREHFDRVLGDEKERYPLAAEALFQTPGQDGEKFVRRSRAMMLIVAIALGVVIATWAGKLSGGPAAVVACALYCLDPNFLGHAAIVKNDIAVTLALTCLAMSAWSTGLQFTWRRGVIVVLSLCACVTVKFSGLIALPVLGILLLVRVLFPIPWNVLGREAATRMRRLIAAMGLMIACCVAAFGAIWASYHFRYDPTPIPGATLDRAALYWRLAMPAPQAGLSPIDLQDSEVQYTGWEFGPLRWVVRAHLLPEAYMHGLLYQMDTTRGRMEYLCGRYSTTGWWYYFPLAMLFKTPVTTIAVIFLSGTWGFLWVLRKSARWKFSTLWAAACLGIPFVVFGVMAMRSNLNIGLRHVFPLYPPMFITAGVVAARMRLDYPRWMPRIGVALAALLAVETFSAFPNYIAFFNIACGGSRGGLNLLGDSNLDWGQDLPALAQWQQKHPQTVLRIQYFGMVDPKFYGIQFVSAPPRMSDVYAISATNLQGIYGDSSRIKMARLRKEQPIDVLGGTIYLYSWPSIQHAHALDDGIAPSP